jgi:hypothetical protein
MRCSFIVCLLVSLAVAVASASTKFAIASPDSKFDAVCDFASIPPFRIVQRNTGRFLASMDEERVGNRGLDATWAPDSRVLVVLVHWRLGDAIHVFRLSDNRFRRDEGPAAPEAFLDFAGWAAPNKLELKGEKKKYMLTITPDGASFDKKA